MWQVGDVYLGFADDLLLLYIGDIKPVQLLFEEFNKFSVAFDLVANLNMNSFIVVECVF